MIIFCKQLAFFYLVKSQSHTVLWALLCNLSVPFKPSLGCCKSFFNRIKVWGRGARKIERYMLFIYCKIFYQHVEIHTNYSQWTLTWITATHHILQGQPITQLDWQKLLVVQRFSLVKSVEYLPSQIPHKSTCIPY